MKTAPDSALQREIRQNKPFRSPAEEAMLGLFRTVDQARRVLTTVVSPYDLTVQQYNVLRILRGAGPTGLPTLEVAARMIEQAPGVTRLLDRMEAKGLVRRDRCTNDRRQVLCFITPEGNRQLAALDDPMFEAAQQVMSKLSEKDLRTLIRLLDALRANQ